MMKEVKRPYPQMTGGWGECGDSTEMNTQNNTEPYLGIFIIDWSTGKLRNEGVTNHLPLNRIRRFHVRESCILGPSKCYRLDYVVLKWSVGMIHLFM